MWTHEAENGKLCGQLHLLAADYNYEKGHPNLGFCRFIKVRVPSLSFNIMLFISCQQLSLKGFAGDTAKAHAKTSMIAGEGVSNIRTVAAFNAQNKILSLFRQELQIPQRRSLSRSTTSGFLFGLSQLALYGSEALILWYGAHLVRSGTSTFSRVIKVFVVLVITANSVAETVSLAPEIIRGGESIRSIFSILNRITRIDSDDPDAELMDSVRGEIELRHALVGASGSGKSSVIALIERFYDPTAGKVMIDGKDIRRLNLKSLRQRIGLVQQEPALFAATIFDNIAYGKDGAAEEEVVEAARAANVHGFVRELPDGYKTRSAASEACSYPGDRSSGLPSPELC
ncbi:ABC transporter B family member 19 [Platanthera guangdongensis]|uniref:ABC transporter B family member 19 n=1 Tax=Platanthera guangdongensis TaxID=2320717 RepID=A0ABR2LIR9_9ASPA